MRLLLLALAILTVLACNRGPGMAPSAKPITGAHSSFIPAGYDLVWNDEFDYEGLPSSEHWGYQTGGHGWGREELQLYTKDREENARVENGHLVLTARRENAGRNQFTSTRLVSKRKAEFTYGFFDIRAKMPSGRGLWPTIWMVGDTVTQIGWPNAGEIDIAEHHGRTPDSVYAAAQCIAANYANDTERSSAFYLPNAETAFNNYSLYWDRDELIWYINGEEYHREDRPDTFSTSNWPYQWPFYLIFNISVGGFEGGPVDGSIFPSEMLIDYVRVYQEAY